MATVTRNINRRNISDGNLVGQANITVYISVFNFNTQGNFPFSFRLEYGCIIKAYRDDLNRYIGNRWTIEFFQVILGQQAAIQDILMFNAGRNVQQSFHRRSNQPFNVDIFQLVDAFNDSFTAYPFTIVSAYFERISAINLGSNNASTL
jgi:hypothetical protein